MQEGLYSSPWTQHLQLLPSCWAVNARLSLPFLVTGGLQMVGLAGASALTSLLHFSISYLLSFISLFWILGSNSNNENSLTSTE